MIQFNTDLEGPLTKNDNAFELCSHFLERGDKFFKLISRYDDVLADILQRKGYEAGGTLKLILPFFKAYALTDEDIRNYSKEKLELMPEAREVLNRLQQEEIPCFIISSCYEHYMRAACEALNFPFEYTYSTKVNINAYQISGVEQEELKKLYKEIISMPMIEIPQGVTSIKDFSRKDQETIKRLDEIFQDKIAYMESGRLLTEVKPVGGKEKVEAIYNSLQKTGRDFSDLIYVGDSITDAEALALVKQKGGLAISFNGNRYALKSAEVACLSESTQPLYAIAKAFQHGRKLEVLALIKEGTVEGARITTRIDEELIQESEALRCAIRGRRVGELG